MSAKDTAATVPWTTGDFAARCRSVGVRGVVLLLERNGDQGVSLLGAAGGVEVEVVERWQNENDLPRAAELALARFKKLVAGRPN